VKDVREKKLPREVEVGQQGFRKEKYRCIINPDPTHNIKI
jgi:hypothetical protein